MRAGSTYYEVNSKVVCFGKRLRPLMRMELWNREKWNKISPEDETGLLPEIKYAAIKEWQAMQNE